jgi:putative glutathione S-transferase
LDIARSGIIGNHRDQSTVIPDKNQSIRTFTSLCVNKSSVNKGLNLLELSSGIIPQGKLVTVASESWKLLWKTFMTELAPQEAQTGRYMRPKYAFTSTTTASSSSSSEWIDEPGRYRVYVGNPCPWCHRVALALQFRGFIMPDSKHTPIAVTELVDDPRKARRGGWILPQTSADASGIQDLYGVYNDLVPGFRGRCTAPLLVDEVDRRIVSNESSDIVRFLNRVQLGTDKNSSPGIDLVPTVLESYIDETNAWVYELLNDGVYRCGFATTQDAYDRAAKSVREGLRRCEERLEKSRFLCGEDGITDADLRLLPTVLRFDAVYAPLFKAGGTHIKIRADYPNLFRWLRMCWEMPQVRNSIDLADACSSYYRQLFPLNPGGIIPLAVTACDLGLEE